MQSLLLRVMKPSSRTVPSTLTGPRSVRTLMVSPRNADAPNAPQGFLYARQKRNRGNVFIGMGLTGFVGAVYMYSMWAIKQEDFSDVDDLAQEARQAEEKKLQREQQQTATK